MASDKYKQQYLENSPEVMARLDGRKGLVKKKVKVKGENGKTFERTYWVKPGDVAKGAAIAAGVLGAGALAAYGLSKRNTGGEQPDTPMGSPVGKGSVNKGAVAVGLGLAGVAAAGYTTSRNKQTETPINPQTDTPPRKTSPVIPDPWDVPTEFGASAVEEAKNSTIQTPITSETKLLPPAKKRPTKTWVDDPNAKGGGYWRKYDPAIDREKRDPPVIRILRKKIDIFLKTPVDMVDPRPQMLEVGTTQGTRHNLSEKEYDVFKKNRFSDIEEPLGGLFETTRDNTVKLSKFGVIPDENGKLTTNTDFSDKPYYTVTSIDLIVIDKELNPPGMNRTGLGLELMKYIHENNPEDITVAGRVVNENIRRLLIKDGWKVLPGSGGDDLYKIKENAKLKPPVKDLIDPINISQQEYNNSFNSLPWHQPVNFDSIRSHPITSNYIRFDEGTPLSELEKKDGKVYYQGRWWQVNKPVPSTAKDKKKMVLAKKGDRVKLVHFGQDGYEDYTQHGSKDRRSNYLTRSAGIRDKDGNLTKDDPFSPNYWARKVLWPRSDSYQSELDLYTSTDRVLLEKLREYENKR
jgi:hypothetical protein